MSLDGTRAPEQRGHQSTKILPVPENGSQKPPRGFAPPVGSSWDAAPGPDATRPEHLAEWIDGSAVAPELAAANVQTLQGSAVLEALAGDRLEALGAHASQYATGAVGRLLRPLEPLAEAGGWWCSGLDPLADWAPMAWGQLKPDAPRWDPAKGAYRKYEAPTGTRTRSIWLRVPATIAARAADRFGLALPPEVAADADGSAGAFWRWAAAEPRLPVIVTEGAKKAGALLSIGLPAAALPGVDSGAKRSGPEGFDGRRTGPIELLADLAAFPWAERQALILFDHSDSANGRKRVGAAARRLGRKLAAAGAAVRVGTCPGPHKGADDHLRAGGTWEQLAAALQPLTPDPVLPEAPAPAVVVPAGRYLSDALDLADLQRHRLLCVRAPMGAGKTRLARLLCADPLATGGRIWAPTHRTSLGESAAAAVGIPWRATPGTDARLQGSGLCWDSFRPSSELQIRPADTAGSVLLLDEIAQGVEHVLFGTGTAVAQHRPETMASVAQALQTMAAAVAMDAQLSAPVVRLLEALSGSPAHVLQSAQQPMAGRPVVVPQGLTTRTAADQGRARVLGLAKARARVLVVTTCKGEGHKGAARNLARMVRKHWPEARILTIDSDATEGAELLAADPNGTAAAHDWIIATPSITSGLSIDAPGLFDAVVVIGAGGQLAPEHLAQAAARVRDPGCPVWLYAPATAPALRIGSGETNPAALLEHLSRSCAQLLADLVGAAGWDRAAANESPWLRCWLEIAATRNGQSHAYAASAAALLEAEGWEVEAPDATGAPDLALQLLALEASADLAVIATEAQAAADQAIQEARLLTDAEAAELQRRRRRTPAERAQLERWRIARRWGLGDAPPTPELLEADRDRLSQRLRFRWILQTPDARNLARHHDHQRRQQLTHNGSTWAPDLVRELLGHRIAAADAIGLPGWLERGEWFDATDPQLLRLQAHASAHASDLRAALGVSPGARAAGTLRALLRLTGHRLEARRCRSGGGQRGWQYRIEPEPLPAGADPLQLQAAWADQLHNPTR